MANRFPLVVNPTTKEIQEIAQNDNLDLTGNGIYAGGSLGLNGQVLTTNGTSVEWRTVSSSGGGGGGIDSDTTYIVEAEDQADGASINLVAGGSGVGTIKIKFADNDLFQFDTVDSLTISPSIKSQSIENNQLKNSSITFTINGGQQVIPLGGSVLIPQYGDVFRTGIQTLTNKTFSDCEFSFASASGNTIVSIPNSALINRGITINGDFIELGESVNIVGGGGNDSDTTYTLSTIGWNENGVDNPSKKAIRLTGSDGSTSNAVLVAGDRLTISESNGEITFNATEVNVDTNTTYNVSSTTLLAGNTPLGAKINLIPGGSGSTDPVDSINLRSGTGITVSSTTDSDVTFNISQDISPTSNVTFNNLTLTGSLTVEGALTYVDTTNLVVSDKTITIADGVTNSELANGAGILIGTSNINFTYNHDVSSWQSNSNMNLVTTKAYKIGGNEVLSETRVLGKTMPLGNVVGTLDVQTLSNKTINSPVMTEIVNTGTVYFPAPPIADTLVARNTQDTLTNKIISGNNNTLQDIGNSSLANSSITINGTSVSLGGTINVSSTDPYSDEKAQDAVAGSFTNGVYTGISFVYDDTTGRINATVSAASNAPVAVGCINMNGTSPTWTGTSNYTVTGAQPSGAGTDYVYTLTFPSAYSARTDYIVQATYDGTDYVSSNSCELAVARGTASVVFTPRRLDGQPLSGGDIMVTITEL